MYFPGLSLTVAFPEGREVQSTRVPMNPACPFTTDLQESLPILLGLAPKLAKNNLAEFAKILSSELAKDPALALSPVTPAVVRALNPQGRVCGALYSSYLFDCASTWGQASMAGILCQLGMTFLMPPRPEVQDF